MFRCARAVQCCGNSMLFSIVYMKRLCKQVGAVLAWHQTGMAEVNRAVGKAEQQTRKDVAVVCQGCTKGQGQVDQKLSICDRRTSRG